MRESPSRDIAHIWSKGAYNIGIIRRYAHLYTQARRLGPSAFARAPCPRHAVEGYATVALACPGISSLYQRPPVCLRHAGRSRVRYVGVDFQTFWSHFLRRGTAGVS